MPLNSPIKKIMLFAVLAGAAATAALAQISIHIGIAPPQPHYEVVPVLAPSQVWAPGYWAWTGDRHVWIRGHAILQREGYRWTADSWEQRGDGYYRQPGYWVRDNNYVFVKEKKAKKYKDDRDDDKRGKRHGKSHKHDD